MHAHARTAPRTALGPPVSVSVSAWLPEQQACGVAMPQACMPTPTTAPLAQVSLVALLLLVQSMQHTTGVCKDDRALSCSPTTAAPEQARSGQSGHGWVQVWADGGLVPRAPCAQHRGAEGDDPRSSDMRFLAGGCRQAGPSGVKPIHRSTFMPGSARRDAHSDAVPCPNQPHSSCNVGRVVAQLCRSDGTSAASGHQVVVLPKQAAHGRTGSQASDSGLLRPCSSCGWRVQPRAESQEPCLAP